MFLCVWLHFKKCFEKYFLVFGCVLENTIENIFSTCCSHFLVAKQIYNSIHSSIQKHKQNPEKKSSNPVKLREEGREIGDWVRWGARSRGGGEGEIAQRGAAIAIDAKTRLQLTQCFARSRSVLREIAIDALRDHDRRGVSRDRNRHEGEIAIDDVIFLPLRVYESFFLSLFLPLRVCELLSLRVSVPEVIWR